MFVGVLGPTGVVLMGGTRKVRAREGGVGTVTAVLRSLVCLRGQMGPSLSGRGMEEIESLFVREEGVTRIFIEQRAVAGVEGQGRKVCTGDSSRFSTLELKMRLYEEND